MLMLGDNLRRFIASYFIDKTFKSIFRGLPWTSTWVVVAYLFLRFGGISVWDILHYIP